MTVTAVDLFCGAGGFSEGLRQACDDLGLDLVSAAINHWEPAIQTHETNHPHAHQYHSKVEQLHPPHVIREVLNAKGEDPDAVGTDVDLLVAGPECTHFSNARGGKPVNEQKRMSPWTVLDWLEKLNVETFIIENVGEIRDWGPVVDGQPTRNGEIFEAWVNALNKLGYSVTYPSPTNPNAPDDLLNAADYGDPTSRERFFLIGTQSGQATFPEPTHSRAGENGKREWRTAAEIIDWSDLGGSIWTRDLHDGRKTPPKNSTMQRIGEGIRRHCGEPLEPFADVLDQLGRDEIHALRDDRVVPYEYADTVAAAVEDPFLVELPDRSGAALSTSYLLGQQSNYRPWEVHERPVPTISKSGSHAITTVEGRSLLMPKNGMYRGIHSNPLYPPEDRPFHTVTTDPRAKLVSPSLVRYSHGGRALSVDKPMPTIATERGGVFALSSPYLCPLYNGREGQRPRTRAVDRPLMTVTASKSPAGLTTPLVRPFIDDYEGPAASVDRPLGTVTSKDRFALCVPELWPWGLDIKYRMLQPRELKQAQGFPADYEIHGTKQETTAQIGNAVPVNLARALCKHLLTDNAPDLSTYGGGVEADPNYEVPDYETVARADGGEGR